MRTYRTTLAGLRFISLVEYYRLCVATGSADPLIIFSVSAGHEDVVRELLGAGADVAKTNDKGLTSL